MYAALQERIDSIDEALSEVDFRDVRIPPLCQIVLDKARDNKSGIVEEMIALRDRHSLFRASLNAHDAAWKAADTRRERLRLEKEFANAWGAIVKGENEPKTRLIYTVWDILKAPTKIPQAIGDKLAAKGKESAIVAQVGGLHTFWRELSNAPVRERNARLLSRLFPRQLPTDVWESSIAYHKAIESKVAGAKRQ